MARSFAYRHAAEWAGLVLLSAVFAALWTALGLPAALLLGPMVAGILFALRGMRLAVPRIPFMGAQAMIGAMVSASITPEIVAIFGRHWLLFAVVVLSTLGAGAALGWLISRSGFISGSTAVYGASPGAAAAMILQAQQDGADARIVAFMLYVRVLFVVFAAALVARFWVGHASGHLPAPAWLAPVRWGNLALVILIALLAQQAARLLRLPSWAILGPMLLLSALHATGVLDIELPRWLLAAAYAVLGWYIGLSFRRDVLLHAWRILPVVSGLSLSLMAFCVLLAWCLTRFAAVDGLTAYLATSPGGLDSIAVIAASTPQVDVEFVLALQSARLLLAIALSPFIARAVVRHSAHLRGNP